MRQLKAKYLRYRAEGVNKETKEKYPEAWIYIVVGSDKDLDEFETNQADACRWLQPDGKVSNDPTEFPVWYSYTPAGLEPTISWSPAGGINKETGRPYERGMYFGSKSYQDTEDAFYRKKAAEAAMQTAPTIKEEEPELAPKPVTPTGRGRGRR